MDADFLTDQNPKNIKNNRGKGSRKQKLKNTANGFLTLSSDAKYVLTSEDAGDLRISLRFTLILGVWGFTE